MSNNDYNTNFALAAQQPALSIQMDSAKELCFTPDIQMSRKNLNTG